MFKRTMLVIALAAIPAAAQDGAPRDSRSTTRPVTANPRVDRQADAVLRRMSDYLSSLRSFRLRTDATDEVVLPSEQKLQQISSSEISVRRPGMLRSDRIGPREDATFRYDGRQFALFGRRSGLYAVAPAPPTLDAALDAARERLGIEAPAADLLTSNPYRTLTEDTESGMYVGLEPIDGTMCHHLAFRNAAADWQIWIQDGPQPLPRRYVITSRNVPAHPAFTVQMSNWEPQANLSAELFRFEPPPGARRIDFLGPRVAVRDINREGR